MCIRYSMMINVRLCLSFFWPGSLFPSSASAYFLQAMYAPLTPQICHSLPAHLFPLPLIAPAVHITAPFPQTVCQCCFILLLSKPSETHYLDLDLNLPDLLPDPQTNESLPNTSG